MMIRIARYEDLSEIMIIVKETIEDLQKVTINGVIITQVMNNLKQILSMLNYMWM